MQRSDINKNILRLAIPSIVNNITVPLLGLCDTAISGHLGSGLYLGAIAVGAMAVNSIFWILGFLRMGTTGLTAQAEGAGDVYNIRLLFTRAILLALGLGLLLIALHQPLGRLIMSVISPGEEIRELSAGYFNVVVFGAPAMLSTMVISGWFLGMQTSVQPMIIAISTNVLNILLSIFFAFGCGMGFNGTAWGTFAAQWAGLLIALLLLRRFNGGRLPLAPLRPVLARGGWGRFINVNVYIFFRSFCIIAVTMSVTSIGASLGTAILAANAVIMQFFHIFSYFMDGFAFAGEALAGKAVGARDKKMLHSCSLHLGVWGLGVTVVFILIYMICGTFMSALITDDADTLLLVSRFDQWLWLPALCGAPAFIFDGIFIGLTATRSMLVSTLMGLIGFFFAMWCLPIAGNNGLWTAFVIYLCLRGAYLMARYPSASNAVLVK